MRARHTLPAILLVAALGACNESPTSLPSLETQPPVTTGSGGDDATSGDVSMEMQSGGTVTETGNGMYSVEIQVRVFIGQNPAEGETVNFTVVSGGGTVSPASAVSDADGYATTTLTYPPNIENTVDASGPSGIATRTTVATYVNYRGIIRSGGTNAFSGRAGAALAEPVVIEVVDAHGAPLPNEPVHIEVLDGSVSSTDLITDANGRAGVTWTLKAQIGLNRLKFTGTDLVPHYAHAVGG
jgi:hypothetical protein